MLLMFVLVSLMVTSWKWSSTLTVIILLELSSLLLFASVVISHFTVEVMVLFIVFLVCESLILLSFLYGLTRVVGRTSMQLLFYSLKSYSLQTFKVWSSFCS